MKMAKRLLLILSIVALMVCALVVTASADSTTTNADGSITTDVSFSDVTSTTYATYTYANGWIVSYGNGAQKASNATLLAYNDNSDVSTLTSPELTGGISSLKFTYWYPNSESTANIVFTVKLFKADGTEIVAQEITTSRDVSKGTSATKYSFDSENYEMVKSAMASISATDSYKIQIYNNGTAVAKNKSRLGIADLSYTTLASSSETPVEKTDAEKAQADLAAIGIATTVTESGSATLPLVGGSYESTITWASDSEFAVVDNTAGAITYTVPAAGEADVTVTLTATAVNGDATETKTFEVTIVAPVQSGDDTTGFALEIGKGYTISANNATGLLYFNGTVTSGRFNGTYDEAEAAVVYVEASANEGEYLLYFFVGDVKTYVVMADKAAGGSFTPDATSATVFEWNSEKLTLAVADDSNNRAFGCGATATYANFSAYDISGSYNWGQFTAVSGDNNEGGDETPVEKTDAEKAQADLAAIGIATTVTKSGSVTLPLIGGSYESAITWASNSELAVVDNTAGTVTYTVPAAGEADVTVTLTATAVNGDATETKTFEITLDAPLKPLDAFVPVEGIGYKFAMLHTTNEKTYYINGSMNSYYMATTTDSDSAAIVYIENTDDGFYMYTFVDGAKKYMNMTVSGTHVNATFDDTASTVYTYSTEINGPIATVNGTEYAFGTYGTYITMGTTKTSYTDNYFGQFVEPENPISFEGAALNINSNIDMMYYVSIVGEPTSVSATYVFNGVTTTVTKYTIGEDGRYCFVFEGINPHQMADVVDVTISATYDETTYTANNATMSVRKYYEIAKEYLAEDTKLLTLISDLLVYGAAAQTYVGDTDALVTEGLELTPTTTEFVAPESVFASTGEAFKSATLYLDHAVTVRFTVEAAEDAVIRVTLNDKVQEYNVAELEKNSEGRYIVEFVDVYATEYAGTITATVVGKEDSVTYSVNSYISEMADADDPNLVALVKALYTYGATARNYN